MKTLLKTTAFCLMAGSMLATSAHAGTAYSETVERIDLAPGDGINYHVVLNNVSQNKYVEAVDIQPESNTIDLDIVGNVKCAKDKDIDYDKAKAYLGTVTQFAGEPIDQNVLYSATYHPSFTQWDGAGNGKWNSESGNDEPFSIPLAQIKNGHPALRFDPKAELEKKLQQWVNSGKKKADFYKQDHSFTVQRPITLAGWCRETISFSQAISRGGYNTEMMDINVMYHGDKDVTDVPTINAQLVNNTPNEVNAGPQPIKLTNVAFQANMPDYIGKCPPAQDPLIRFNCSGQGKGKIRFSVEDGSAVYGTQDIAFDSKNGQQHHDFHYPLKAKLVAEPNWNTLNKTFNHNLKVRAKLMDENSNSWGPWKDYTTSLWKHRCTPQVSVGTGGIGGAKFDNGGEPKPQMGIQQSGQQQNAAPKLKLQQGDVDPKPPVVTVNPVIDTPSAEKPRRKVPSPAREETKPERVKPATVAPIRAIEADPATGR